MNRFLSLFSKRFFRLARQTVFPFEQANSSPKYFLIFFYRLIYLVVKRLFRDKCPRVAAALSFQTILSLVPLSAVVFSFSAEFQLELYLNQIISYFETNLVPHSAVKASDFVRDLANGVHLRTLGIVGISTLLFLCLALLFNIEQVLNEIFRSPVRRSFFSRFFSGIFLIAFAPIAFGFSLYFTKDVLLLPSFLGAGLPLFFSTITLFLCYWLLPHAKIRLSFAFSSALFCGIFFELLKIGFAVYANYLGGTLSYVYGTFAILPLFFVWIYVTWLLFLFGAEFNAALHEVKHHQHFSLLFKGDSLPHS